MEIWLVLLWSKYIMITSAAIGVGTCSQIQRIRHCSAPTRTTHIQSQAAGPQTQAVVPQAGRPFQVGSPAVGSLVVPHPRSWRHSELRRSRWSSRRHHSHSPTGRHSSTRPRGRARPCTLPASAEVPQADHNLFPRRITRPKSV